MVEYTLQLDSIFGSLSDPTRRDILRRVAKNEMSVSEIAKPYNLSFAAVSKHLKVLEKALLIVKHKNGKKHMIQLAPQALASASEYLEWYGQFMDVRYDALESYINKGGK
ncbi:MAG TPA: metalloregulator ArsR/SmtB family transcription factor [Patescibacteria group bacterium]|nr:metalloregulator ArsR/SmtB family transcription factor [Patescibacteria group bacterium]